jgi:Ohr subfamily peroxiredoxin
MSSVLYTAIATATGAGRGGRVRSSDDVLDLELSVPAQLGGPGDAATNPEQLFAAGYSACFHSALQLIARKQRIALQDSTVTAEVGIGPSGAGYGLTVSLVVDAPGLPREQAEALAAAAHQVCPYSNATRGNVDVQLRVA